MKMKVIAILVMLAMMAFLPFAAAKLSTKIELKKVMATADSADKKDNDNFKDEDKVICGLVAALYKSEYSTETIKAMSILLNNDYTLNPEKFDLSDSNICLYVENADNNMKEIYSQIEDIVNSSKKSLIYYNDKNVFVPYSETSNGNTVSAENYDYISPVASPWDCFSNNFDKNAECVGVSINGLDYLCKNGMSAEEALIWYLPECEIK